MSTELAYQYAIDSVCGDNFGSDVWNEFAHGLRTTIYARVSEYDATPAVEVTADAVEVARTKLGSYAKYIGTKELQAALAAALPALVQQVERLTAEVADLRASQQNDDRDHRAMSAANAQAHAEITKICDELDERWGGQKFETNVMHYTKRLRAATAQAKLPTLANQGYDDTGSATHD
jgi:hypothetical protein